MPESASVSPSVSRSVSPSISKSSSVSRSASPSISVSSSVSSSVSWSPSPSEGFEVLTIQPDAASGKDTNLQDTDATTNYGNATSVIVGNKSISPNNTDRTLIQFDLSSIPAGSTIESVVLSLYLLSESSSNDRTLRVYRMKRSWTEGDGTAGSGATWDTYDGVNNWTTSGGFDAADCEQTDIGSRDFSSTEAISEFKDFSLTVSAIQDMLDGIFTNNGFLIKADTEDNDQYTFRSSDHFTASQRPKITIAYRLSTASASVSPTVSPSVSPSASASPTASASESPSISLSPSISPSVSPSASASATESPSESPSVSPSLSPSESPSISPSPSESPSVSPSLSPSVSPSASASPTESPSVSASVSPSESPSVSPSISQSLSESPSVSPSFVSSESPSESPSVSPSISPSVSPSISQSASVSPTESPSASPSVSPSLSQSASLSQSLSESPSISPSIGESTSVSPSISPSRSVSPSVSRSISQSASPSPTPSGSPSRSASRSVSRSLSPSRSKSGSASPSHSPSPSLSSVSPSASSSPSPAYIPEETMFSGASNRYIDNTGLTAQFSTPIAPLNNLWVGGPITYFSTSFLFTVPIDNRFTAYSHTINADGGYDSASITLVATQNEIDDWIDNGLGRDVKIYNNNGGIVWEGFVNVVRINKGIASVSRGPLMDVGNEVLVIYTPIVDKELEDPVTGDQTETPLGYDEESIQKYGLLEKHISGGQLVDANMYGTYVNEALYLRDTVLLEIKDPQEDITVNYSSPTEPSITLECRGYYDWLSAYVFYDDDNLANDSYLEVSTKIWVILAYEPNGVIFYTENPDSIEYNPLLVALGEIRNRFAKNVIEECVALGDVFGKRWLFYIDEGRVARYHQIPEDIDYKIRVTDRELIVETILGDKVKPWDVKPGKWASLDDFMTSGPNYDTISSNYFRTDAKMMFVESVQFTAPNTVTLAGGRIGRMKQVMAQLGVGG